jgi:3-oxoadipate enol-lactonase
MSIQFVTAKGCNFAYRWEGLSSGPVLMLAHAMGTSHRIWDKQIDALKGDFRILRYDWRGHGDSDSPTGPYSLSQFSDDAVGVMDALELERVHWVGISTGGMIGQGLGIHHGHRLRSLTLCNTTSESSPWYRSWVAERQAVVRESGMQPVWEMTKKLWFNDAFVDAAGIDYEAIKKVFVATSVTGYLGGTSAVTDLNYTQDLHRITVPTLVIAAGDDPVTPLANSQTIHTSIAGSELQIVAHQRHFSNVEAPQEFNQILVSFLKRQRD